MKNTSLISLIVLAASFVLSGCVGIPLGAKVETVRTPSVIYLHALVRGNQMLCPSRVALVVTNFDSVYPLEVAVDSEVVTNVPPNGKVTIMVPEAPFSNSFVIVSGVLWGSGPSGRQNTSNPYQFSMPNYGAVQGLLTASNRSVSGSYQRLYSAYGY